MTRPTARVLALLELLQSGGTHTVPTFAARLGVNEPTLRRYAQHLTDLRIPIDSRALRRLPAGPRLQTPALMLADDAGWRSCSAPIVPDRTWNGADAATVP